MAQPDFYAILDGCLERVRRGDSVDACLADFPAEAAELAPALALSAELYHLPRLEPAAAAAARDLERVLAVLDEEPRPAGGFWASLGAFLSGRRAARRPVLALARAAVLAGLILAAGGGLIVTASAESLPGDPLYGVKRGWESARLSLAADESARQALLDAQNARRRAEIEALVVLHRPAEVEFSGRLESRGDGIWTFDGLPVRVTGQTDFGGSLEPGQPAEVEVRVEADGSITAVRIDRLVDRPAGAIPPTRTPTATERPAFEATPTRRATREATPTRRPTREATPTRRATRDATPTREAAPTRHATRTRPPTREATPTKMIDRNPTPTKPPDRDPTPTKPPDRDPTPTKPPDRDPTPTRSTDRQPTPTKPPDRPPTPTPTRLREITPTPRPTDSPGEFPTPTPGSDGGGGGDGRP